VSDPDGGDAQRTTTDFQLPDDAFDTALVRDPWRAIHDQIREMILSGAIPPGQRLVESRLAEHFGTSRGPVRTAIKELAHAGIVVNTPRRGTFVRELTDTDVEEVFSLWEAIWPLAVSRAVSRLTPERIEQLRRLVPPPPEEINVEQAIKASMAFYHAIFVAAEHSRLLDIWENLTHQAQFRLVLAGTAEKRRIFGVNPVAVIADAIERRDADAAVEVCFTWTRKMRTLALTPTTKDHVGSDGLDAP
jgi:DNA-binding GntR family transcriptional regulator